MSRWHTQPGLPSRGARVVLQGHEAPVMTVARHTQYDNGEVECIWFTPDHVVQRAWLPASLLRSPPRQPFKAHPLPGSIRAGVWGKHPP
jgi:uncharacterized protein YodC (DUF2158 family)